MPENKPTEPLTDEQIENLVQLVESAEQFAKVFKVSTPQAMRMMLTSFKIMTQVKAGVPLQTIMRQLMTQKPS